MTSWHEHFSLFAPVQLKLHRFSYSNGTIPNAPKHYETHPKMNLLSNRLDQVRSLQNYPTRPRGTYFFQLCHQFNPNCIEFRTVTKRSKMHQNTTNSPKHEFRVQCSGPSAFVWKMFDTTSCHELFSLIAQVSAQIAPSFV